MHDTGKALVSSPSAVASAATKQRSKNEVLDVHTADEENISNTVKNFP